MTLIACSYCGRTIMYRKDGSGTSHGICDRCLREEQEKYGLVAAPTGRTHETHPRGMGTGGAAFYTRGDEIQGGEV